MNTSGNALFSEESDDDDTDIVSVHTVDLPPILPKIFGPAPKYPTIVSGNEEELLTSLDKFFSKSRGYSIRDGHLSRSGSFPYVMCKSAFRDNLKEPPICILCRNKHASNEEVARRLGTLIWFPKYPLFFAVHESCLLMCPMVANCVSTGGPHTPKCLSVSHCLLEITLESISKEVRRAQKLECYACKLGDDPDRGIATIGCFTAKCRRSIHVPCAISTGWFLDYAAYRCFCPSHFPTPREYKTDIADAFVALRSGNFEERAVLEKKNGSSGVCGAHSGICLVCFDEIPAVERRPIYGKVVYTFCCRELVYHFDCMTKMASCRGLAMRCPHCNNDEQRSEFQTCLNMQGVLTYNIDPDDVVQPPDDSACLASLLRDVRCLCNRGDRYKRHSTLHRYEPISCAVCAGWMHRVCAGHPWTERPLAGVDGVNEGHVYTCPDCSNLFSSDDPLLLRDPRMSEEDARIDELLDQRLGIARDNYDHLSRDSEEGEAWRAIRFPPGFSGGMTSSDLAAHLEWKDQWRKSNENVDDESDGYMREDSASHYQDTDENECINGPLFDSESASTSSSDVFVRHSEREVGRGDGFCSPNSDRSRGSLISYGKVASDDTLSDWESASTMSSRTSSESSGSSAELPEGEEWHEGGYFCSLSPSKSDSSPGNKFKEEGTRGKFKDRKVDMQICEATFTSGGCDFSRESLTDAPEADSERCRSPNSVIHDELKRNVDQSMMQDHEDGSMMKNACGCPEERGRAVESTSSPTPGKNGSGSGPPWLRKRVLSSSSSIEVLAEVPQSTGCKQKERPTKRTKHRNLPTVRKVSVLSESDDGEITVLSVTREKKKAGTVAATKFRLDSDDDIAVVGGGGPTKQLHF